MPANLAVTLVNAANTRAQVPKSEPSLRIREMFESDFLTQQLILNEDSESIHSPWRYNEGQETRFHAKSSVRFRVEEFPKMVN